MQLAWLWFRTRLAANFAAVSMTARTVRMTVPVRMSVIVRVTMAVGMSGCVLVFMRRLPCIDMCTHEFAQTAFGAGLISMTVAVIMIV